MNTDDGCGLSVTCLFTRETSLYGPTTHYLRLTLTNGGGASGAPANNVNMEIIAKEDDQQVYPFPEVSCIKANETVTVDLHVDFAGRHEDPITFSIESELGANTCSLVPAVGDMVKPAEMTYDDFNAACSGMNDEQALGGDVECQAKEHWLETFQWVVDG
jgi:hypothetical protein